MNAEVEVEAWHVVTIVPLTYAEDHDVIAAGSREAALARAGAALGAERVRETGAGETLWITLAGPDYFVAVSRAYAPADCPTCTASSDLH